MDHFIVSARKYRPEKFDSVVGQSSITATLKNAIRNDHVGHAYLFCGPKGVGKTTCARIFAKTINCGNPIDKTEPCNACESCMSFNEGRSYNIHELDAASNNSVEDIRLLNEKVRIPPQLGRYSTYIIDEVHMLSLSAFNAFLKTLEEPPAHAVFILATTEKYKIIPTILSRCQIFDFKRIRTDDAVKYLEYICREEKIKFEPEALHLIAQKGDGAMRDALSIFDQVVSLCGSNITYKSIIEHLNILDYDYYFNITDRLLEGDVSSCFLIFDEILDKGFDGHNFLNDLAIHLRDLLVSKDPETIKMLEVSENFKSRYFEQSKKCPAEFLFSCLQICNDADVQYKASRNQRLLVEISLIKMAESAGIKKKLLNEERVKEIEETIEKSPEVNPAEEPMNTEVLSAVITEPTSPKKNSLSNKVKVEDRHEKMNFIAERNISIRDVLSGNVSNVAYHPDTEKPEDENGFENPEAILENEFTPEELEIKWKAFADLIQHERPRIAVALRSKYPRISHDFNIDLVLETEQLKEDLINNVKAQLLTYLRKELLNNSVNLNITVEEPENNGRRMLYTPEEKFSYLARKNPSLEKLKQQFNLELE